MSTSGFKFKLKLSTAPSAPSQPSKSTAVQQGSDNRREASGAPAVPKDEASGGHHVPQNDLPTPAAAGAEAPEKKTVFKIKVKQPSAVQQQPASAMAGPLAPKRLAEEQHAQAPKRIKLITGFKKPTLLSSGAGGQPAVSKPVKPKIRLKTSAAPLPPKKPRLPADAPLAAPSQGFAALLEQQGQPQAASASPLTAAAHPVVRLTLPSGTKRARSGTKASAKQGAPGGGPPRKKGGARRRQQHSQQQQTAAEPVEVGAGPGAPRGPATRHAKATSSMAASEGAQPSGSRSLGDEVGMVVGEEEDDDVAFTNAPEAVAGLPSEGAPEGDPNTPALPILPPLAEGGAAAKREDMERVVRLIQRRDHHGIFKDPVTEDVAPGYFKVIQEPMDFTTMRSKLERGEYLTYEDLQRDLRLMFLNAMTYNPAGSPFYSHARAMLFSAEKLVEQARQGVLSQRQAAGEARKHNAQLRAQERAQRDALRAAARAEQRAAQEAKILKKAGVGVVHEESLDESVRNSYRRPLRDAGQLGWRGLGAGASAEGVPFGLGRQMLCPAVQVAPPVGSYKASLLRFAAGLAGRARDLALSRADAASAQASAAAAESLLRKQLAKQPSLADLTTAATAAPLPSPAGPPPSGVAAQSAAPPTLVAASLAAGQPMLPQGMFHPILLQQQGLFSSLQRSQQGVLQGLPPTLSQQQLAAMAATFKQQQQQQQLGTSSSTAAQQQQQLNALLTPAHHQALLLQQQALLAHQRLHMQQQGPGAPGGQPQPSAGASQGGPSAGSGGSPHLPTTAGLQNAPSAHPPTG